MEWGHSDPQVRGPVVVSRGEGTARRRNGKFVHQFISFGILTVYCSNWRYVLGCLC